MSEDQSLGLAGLPSQATDQVIKKRPAVEFTIPATLVGMEWNLDKKFRTFSIAEVTPKEQDDAAKAASGNTSVLSREMIFRSLQYIGGKRANSDIDFRDTWWKSLGPKGRRCVEAAFLSVSSAPEEAIENFLDTGRPVNI